jgi:hypothetical protein
MNKEHQDNNRTPERTANGENAERRGSSAQDPRQTNAGQMAGKQRDNGQQNQQDAGRQERQGEREYERQTGE